MKRPQNINYPSSKKIRILPYNSQSSLNKIHPRTTRHSLQTPKTQKITSYNNTNYSTNQIQSQQSFFPTINTRPMNPVFTIETSSHKKTNPIKILTTGPTGTHFEEAYMQIEALWDDVGVLETYRNIFDNKVRSLHSSKRMLLLTQEKQFLECIRDVLLHYSKEYTNRKREINSLKKLHKVFEKVYISGKEQLAESFVNDVTTTMNLIREYSVNVVNDFIKIREMTSSSSCGYCRFDLSKANPAYKFDCKLLFNINNDLSFLECSTLWKYCNVYEEEYDTFLVNIVNDGKENSNGNERKVKIESYVSQEMMNDIKRCQYMILQEDLNRECEEQVNEDGDVNGKRHNDMISDILIYRGKDVSKAHLVYSNENISSNLHRLTYTKENGSGVFNGKEKKKNKKMYTIEREVSRTSTKWFKKEGKVKEVSEKKVDEEERKRKVKEEEERKRKIEEERRRKQEEEDERRRQEEEEERRRKLKEEEEEEIRRQEEERKRKEQEEERRRQKQEEERKRQEKERKRKKEEEERRRKEEEERKRQEEEEERRRQQEEEEERRRQQEEEERRRRQEEEEEEERRKKEQEEKEEEERKRKEQEEKEQRKQQEEEERKRKEEEENNENFTTTFLPIPLYDYSQTINTYSQHITPFQYQLFQITSPINFSQFLKGNNPKLLLNSPETNPNYLSGLCSLSYTSYTDELGFPQTHLFINHLSTHERAWKKQIKTMISFIKANFDFSILSIILYESPDYPDQHRETFTLFTKDLSFTELPQSNGESDSITLCFSNKSHIVNPLISPIPFSFNFNLISILSLSSSQPDTIPYNYDKYINTFAIKAIIFKLFNEDKIELNESVSIIKWNKSIISSVSSFMNNFKFNIDNHSLPKEVNDTFKFDYKTLTLHKNAINHSLQINFKFAFENMLTVKYNDYIYNRIYTQITTYKDINTNSMIYKLSTLQNDYSIVIMELNNQLKETFIYNGHNIYETFNKWFNSLHEELTEIKVIYIPSFELTAHTDANEIEAFPDNMITENNKEIYINTIDEYFHMKNIYDKSYSHGFTLLPNTYTGDIIINDSFIIGIMNTTIYTEYNIPCIHLAIINKNKWAAYTTPT